jgi:hypothetical protein
VKQAADILQITTGAVRNRLSRGTLRSVKESGTVYVLLPGDMARETERDTGRDIERDTGQNLEELAQRLEALERENRELREALGSGTPDHELKGPQQRPQASQAEGMTVASAETVRDLLLGPRDEQAYSRPFVGVFPSYVAGCLLTCAVAAYGCFIALHITGGNRLYWLWLGAMASLFFGFYGGIRDGGRFVFGRFQSVGLVTAMGTAMAMFLASLWIVSVFWGGPGHEQTSLSFVTEEYLFPIGAVSAGTWLLFVSGALLGTASQHASTTGARAQAWLGFLGTAITALLAFLGNLFGS